MGTPSRAKRVVVGLTLVALIAAAIDLANLFLLDIHITTVVCGVMLHLVMPVTILVINVLVVHQVRRRASNDAADSLGLQHHHQSSSNSAVPTIMLVTASIDYVLLHNMSSISVVLDYVVTNPYPYMDEFHKIANATTRFVYSYNFHVYLCTGKQFRSELHRLVCSYFPSCPAAADDDHDRVTRRGTADTNV